MLTQLEILGKLRAGEITEEAAAVLLDTIVTPGGKKAPSLTVKVQPKGTISVYGLQRMPVTLYPGQWVRFLGDEATLAEILRVANQEIANKVAEAEAAAALKALVANPPKEGQAEAA